MDIADRFTQNITQDENVNWNVIRILIDKYTERHPEEMMGCIEAVKLKRGTLSNDFALTSKDTEMRHLYEMPPTLHYALTLKYPQVLKGKNLRTFLKLYPFFQVAQKV